MSWLLGWMRGSNAKKPNHTHEKIAIEKADMLFLQQNYEQVLGTLKELEVLKYLSASCSVLF